MSSPKALISRVERLITDIRNRMETLAMFMELTPGQQNRIISGSRLVDLDELFDYYQWALKHRFAPRHNDPLINAVLDPETALRKKWNALDQIDLSALAIICEKQLGLTRVDALYAMLRAKRADDYKSLLTPKKPSGPSP